MPRRRALARPDAMENEDINAPLMRQMGNLTIRLNRVVVEDTKTTRSQKSVVSEPTAVSMKIQLGRLESSVPQSDEMDSEESEPNAASQQAKPRGRQLTKKTDKTSMQQLEETNSAKHRGKELVKTVVQANKRALRSNSSIDEISFETPERRTKRKRHNQPSNNLQDITSESTDDDDVMPAAENNKNVLLRRRENNLRSTDEDDSMSRVDNESMELTHSDPNDSMPVPYKLAHSTMVSGKKLFTHSDESESDLTPLLSEKINFPELNSQNAHKPNMVTQNTMDKPIKETPRNVSKSNEDRKEKMNVLKSTFGKVGALSTSFDNNNQNDPQQDGEMLTSSYERDSEEIVHETLEITDENQSEYVDGQKNENAHSSGSVFDTPDEMESNDVETDAGANPSGMNVKVDNNGETSAMSMEENNNMKAYPKRTADVVQSTTAHQENVEENIATALPQSKSINKNVNYTATLVGLYPGNSCEAAARYSDVLNELRDVLEVRNEQKKALESQSVPIHHAASHELSSYLSTMAKNPIDNNENGMMADRTDNEASHNEADDVDMMSNSDAENHLEGTTPSTSALKNSPPKGGNKRRTPAAPTPYRKINKNVIAQIVSDVGMSGPSKSVTEVAVEKPKNKRKLPPVDVFESKMPGPFKMSAKSPTFTRHGFLEETFYEPLPNGIFIFNAKPYEVSVAMDSFNPRKRQRIIEIEPNEVIVIKRSKKRPKNQTAKKISKRRASD